MQSGKKNCKTLFPIIQKTLFILLIIIFVGLLLFHQIFPYFLPVNLIKHNARFYLDGEYKSYGGGQTAFNFFPSQDELGNYSSLDFYYVNNIFRFSVFHGIYGNTFRLDVHYKENAFDTAVLNLFSRYKCTDLYQNNKLCLTWFESYYIVEFEPGAFDDTQYFYICINEKDRTIRFLFMENSQIRALTRMMADFDMSIWGQGLSVDDPAFVKTVQEKYDSYIIEPL